MATAQELIADARSFANDIMGQAHNWLGSATTIASSYFDAISKEQLNVQKLDVTGFAVGDVPTFSESFTVPVGEPAMGSLTPLYVPTLPSFGDQPDPLNTSNLFQTPTPTLNLPEFDGVFPDITTDWDIPVAPVIAFPEAPTITPLDLDDVNLTLPTILDPEVFSETYAPPTSSVGDLELEPAYIPEAPTMPDEPGALDTSGLFQTLKPSFDLAAFTTPDPEVTTEFTMPAEPSVDYPTEPTLVARVVDAVSLTVPELGDAATFAGEFVAPAAAPDMDDHAPFEPPSAVTFPEAPAPLDTSGLFTTPKPEWTLSALDAEEPTIDTAVTIPDAPELTLPVVPEQSEVTITDPSITLPDVSDPEAFAGTWTAPTTAPDDLVLDALEKPSAPVFPDAPDALDTSGLFATPKPSYTVPDLAAVAPTIDTSVTLPDAPVLDPPDAPTVTPVTIADADVPLPVIEDPDSFAGSFTLPDTSPVYPVFESMVLPDLPEFSDAPPALDTSGLFGTPKPEWSLNEFTGEAPTVTTAFTLPAAPEVTFPEAPAIGTVTIGQAPEITLPTFDAEFEGVEPVAPDLSSTFETQALAQRPLLAEFVSDQLDLWAEKYALTHSLTMQRAVADKLSAGLVGGTGLPDSFETNLYARARARIDAEQAAAQAQVLAGLAKRGFVYPSGAMTAALNSLARDYANRLAAFAQETAIERAKMEQQHAQFILSTASALQQAAQQAAVGYAGILVQVNGQAIDYAKLFVAQLAEIYNGALELYKAKMGLWQTQAQVFETQLKAALSVLDRYRLELEAAKLRKDVEALDVQVYEARLTALMRRVEVYSTQVNAVKIIADLERLKIELFNGQVEAYLGQVKAQEAKFGAYRAAIEGDTAKVQGYVAQVDGYRSGVEAEAKKADVGIARGRAVIDYNAGLSEQYRAGLARYQADIDAEKSRFGSAVEAYRAGLDGYQAAIRAKIERLNAEIEQARLNLETAKARKDVEQTEVQIYSAKIQALMARAQLYESQLKGVTTRLEAEKLKLDVYDGEVKAFLARVEAEQGKFQAFKTVTDADTARIEGYRAQVGAYSATVEASAKKSDAEIALARLTIENNQAKHELYRSQLARYQADIDAEKARMGALVDGYRAGLEGYQTAIKARLDRVNAEVETAKLALETAKARKDVDRIDVEIYSAQVQALATRAEIYATQLKGVTTRLDVEKLKLEVYDGLVKAYSTRATAEQSKFQAFKTSIDADSARVQAHGIEVDAYRSQVDAAAKQGDLGIATARLAIESNQELNERYRLGVEKYRAELDGERTRVTFLIDSYRAGLDGYRAAVDAKLGRVREEIDVAKFNLDLVKTRKDFDKTDVDIYTAMTDAQVKRLEVYSAQLSAVKTQADIEKMKVDVYDSLVKAYGARAQAEESKFSAFKTVTDADIARMQGYAMQVDAYKARVDARGKVADIEIAHSKAVNEHNQALIEAYRARLDGYKTDIEAERTRFAAAVDGYRAGIEGYRAMLEGKLKALDAEIKEAELNLEHAKTQTVVDQAQVEVFTARIEGLRSQVAVYAAQVDAVKSRADIERLKVDIFDGKVKAFLGAITGEKAKFEAYESAIKGDTAKVQGYMAQVDAYKSGVDAEAKKADVDMEHGRLVMQSNRNVIEQYQAELEAYRSKLQTEIARFGGHADAYKALLSSYQAQLNAKSTVLDAQVKAKAMELDIAKTQADANLKVNMTNAQLAQKGLEMTVHAAVAAGQASGSMAQAALSGLNALAVVDANDETQ